ncbi:MAG: hypothetical protein Q9192_006112 [Flavoplaca navasiana]
MNSAGRGILAQYYILLSIAANLVGLRYYGRMRFQNGMGWDDISSVAALGFLLIGAVLISIEVASGLGIHIHEFSDPESTELKILKYNTFFQMVNVLCALITKVSISLYILRIKNDRSLRILLCALMVLMSLATVAVIVVLSVSRIPLEALWTPSLQPKAKCRPLRTVYNVAYVQSGFTIVIDLILTLSPIVILWNVRIKMVKKIRICTLMSLGLVATISNALRNAFQSGLTSKDPTYDAVKVTVLAIFELSSGIIAACIPACMAFIPFRKDKGRQWYFLSKTRRTATTVDEAVQSD